MSNEVANKPVVGRQSHLPLSKAFQISLNSLKIRFWRSMVTAAGIFLGIAFLATVLTQSLMQWPIAEEVSPGMVKIDGLINGPGEFVMWKSVPIDEGVKAGIPKNIIRRTANGDGTFSLTAVAQGIYDAKRADKNLARVLNEWKTLRTVKPAFYDSSDGDRDISVGEAKKAGVPIAIARHLAMDSNTFKATALAGAITAHPTWMKIWKARVKRYAEFKKVPQSAVEELDKRYARNIGEIIKDAKGTAKDADMTNVRVVNENGRKLSLNFTKDKAAVSATKLADGDTIMVLDRNIRYRTWWLVIMSLLVCTVGITNSMLMSVTERFKEIGTMKCLGALDKFVVTLFMLESGMMGIVASILGWAVGFILIVLMAGFTKGWEIVAMIGFIDVVKMFFFSVGVGLLLTICATIAPALRAANMPAAMALRTEI